MRHILVTALVLAVTATVASAGKPKIAILGIQPETAADAAIAKDITASLRVRPKAGTGPFTIAPAAEVELADAKATHKCGNEAPACMAAAGAALGADYLVYGHLERTAKGYTVSLKLLDIRAKKPLSAFFDTLGKDAVKPTDLAIWAKKSYAKLVGDEGDTRKP